MADDLVSIECGLDRFAAETLLARCRAEGLTVELLGYDEHGNAGQSLREPFRLLVRADDVESIKAIATGTPTGAKTDRLAAARSRRTRR